MSAWLAVIVSMLCHGQAAYMGIVLSGMVGALNINTMGSMSIRAS